MAINCVKIKNFLVFKGEFTLDFCPGVNVLIGGNATGKTTLLKCLYGSTDTIGHKTTRYFNDPSLVGSKDDVYISRIYMPIEQIEGFKEDEGIFSSVSVFLSTSEKWSEKDNNKKAIMIPANEMLSHSKGFLALCYERMMPFDQIQIDILVNAQFPETREIKPNAACVLDKIKSITGGEVIYDSDVFYTQKESGEKIPFAIESSGFKKLGLLWKLLRNGLLESETILLWDEPENSLNPEQVPLLVDILLELSRNGVQIFLATHSEILASYFSVNRDKGDAVMFYSLYKEGEYIKTDKSDRFDLLVPNNLTLEPVRLYERKLERGLDGNG